MPDRSIARRAALAGLLPALAWGAPAPGAAEDPLLEEVVVEASRAGLTVEDIPVNTSLLSRQDIDEAGLQPVDEILRQVPGFSLLRAADSIASV